jgi:hypothetical protein
MIAHRFLSAAFIVGLFAPHSALALDWEIERNFRYFLYPSDMAAQRIARDLYVVQKGATPTPEQLENLMNGGGFWKTKLGEIGDLRKRWPIDWPRDDNVTPYQLVEQLRAQEGRSAPVAEQELDRRGWASLLVRELSPARPHEATLTGSTETCWNPAQRLHSGCAVWGDYVRPPGWIVRVLIPMRTQGNRANGALPAPSSPRRIHDSLSMRSTMRFRREQQRSPPIAARSVSSFPQFRPRLRLSPVR